MAITPHAENHSGDRLEQDLLPLITSDDFEPHFRAVGAGRERRGIRLERIYWEALGRMSTEAGRSNAEMVERAAERYAAVGNVASMLRVLCFKWLLNHHDRLEESASLQSLQAVVQASPVPTVIITREKKILVFNEPFIAMLKNRFALEQSPDFGRGLRFQIDAHIDEALEKFNSGKSSVIRTNFTVAINMKVLRGKINIAPAPDQYKSRLIGYISEF